jgi:hypothetical protein
MRRGFCVSVSAGSICAMLTSCSTFKALDPAPPFTPSPVGETAADVSTAAPGTAGWWQDAAAQLSDEYQDRYVALVRVRPWFDLPLIGLAASAVGALFYDAPRDTVFGIGLAAGLSGVTRTYLNLGPAATAYLAGSSAAECIVREAAPITAELGPDGAVSPDLLMPEIAAVQTAIEAVEISGLLTKPPPVSQDADAIRRYSEMQILLSNRIQAAREAVRVAQNELDTLKGASAVVGAAVGTIENKVAERVAFQARDFAALQASIIEALSAAATNRATLDQVRLTLRGELEPTVSLREELPQIEQDILQMQQLSNNISAATFALTVETPRITATEAAILQCAAAL